MNEAGAPNQQTGANEVQNTARNDGSEKENCRNLQETDQTGNVKSVPDLPASTGRTLLNCDTVNAVMDPKAMLDVFTENLSGRHEELCAITTENCISSNDRSSDCIVETDSGTLLDKGQASSEQNISGQQYQQSAGEEETVTQIASVEAPNPKQLKLDFINILEPDRIVESDSYTLNGSASAERLESTDSSINPSYDSSNVAQKATGDQRDNAEVEVVILSAVDQCNDEPAGVIVAKHMQTDQIQSKNQPASSDSSGLKIQVFPQNISLVSNSQILTTDVTAFSTQVPAILTEGDAEESDGQVHLPTVPTSSVIITGDACLGSHLTTSSDNVTIVTPDSTTATTDALITQSNPLVVQNVTSEQLTVIPSGEYNHGIILSDQQSVLLGGMTCLVPQGVVNESEVRMNLPASQAMITSLPHVPEGVQATCSDRDDQKVHLCPHPECNKVCSKAHKLKLHLLSHTGERPHKCPHKDCEWAFTTAYKLKRHVRGHTGERPYACTHEGCNKRFTTAYNLKTHVRAHFRSNAMMCSYEGCDKTFPSAHKLRVHERKHELEQKPYRCEVEGCGKEFTVMGTLTSHIKSHSSERPHSCPVEGCEKRFTKASKLKLHVRTHTGERPFACSVEHCNWSFTSAYKLKRHMRKHTGERPFVCTFEGCGKSFTRSSHLKTHTLVHTGEKPYTCPVDGCGKAFTAGSSLNVHMRKHTGEKPFKCEADGCTKAYTTAANLRAHQKRHETHKKPLDGHGSETGSSQVEFVDIHTMSTTRTMHSSGVTEVAYNSIHSFSSDDFTPDDVTSLSAVGVHLLTNSIVTSSSSQLTFSSIDHHTNLGHGVDEDRHNADQPERESVHMSSFQSDVENHEQLEGMDDGTQVDVAEFIVQAEDDGSSGVLQRSPTAVQEHDIHTTGAEPPKHGVFDLPIASVLGHLTPMGANKHGEHHLERKRRRKSRRSLDFRTGVHPEDQFAPPAVIFQDEIIKSGSSDIEGESEGISTHIQRSPEAPLTPSSRQSLCHLVPDPLQVHMSHTMEHEMASHETAIDIDPEVSAVHPIAASEMSFSSHLSGIHENDGINKDGLPSYMESNSSPEQEETNGDTYPESTINLQDLR